MTGLAFRDSEQLQADILEIFAEAQRQQRRPRLMLGWESMRRGFAWREMDVRERRAQRIIEARRPPLPTIPKLPVVASCAACRREFTDIEGRQLDGHHARDH